MINPFATKEFDVIWRILELMFDLKFAPSITYKVIADAAMHIRETRL